jgi:hypothetical protein
MMRIGCFIIIFCFLFNSAQASYTILSASASGKFVVLNNSQTGKKILIDIQARRIVVELNSLVTPLCWVKDSVLIFEDEKDEQVIIHSYNVNTNTSTLLDSTINKKIWKLIDESQLISFPLNIDSWNEFFFIYVKENKIYKYSWMDGRCQCIFEPSLKLGAEINNISVDQKCTQIAISVQDQATCTYFILYPNERNFKIIDKFYSIDDTGNYCYFINNHEIILYKVFLKDDDRVTTVEVFNTQRNSKNRISVIEHLSLINPIGIPCKNRVMINTFSPPSFSIELKKGVSKDVSKIIDKLISSFNAIEIKHSFNTHY